MYNWLSPDPNTEAAEPHDAPIAHYKPHTDATTRPSVSFLWQAIWAGFADIADCAWFVADAVRDGWSRDILPLIDDAEGTLARFGKWQGAVAVPVLLLVLGAFGQAMPLVRHAGLGDWVLLAGLVAAALVGVVVFSANEKKGRG